VKLDGRSQAETIACAYDVLAPSEDAAAGRVTEEWNDLGRRTPDERQRSGPRVGKTEPRAANDHVDRPILSFDLDIQTNEVAEERFAEHAIVFRHFDVEEHALDPGERAPVEAIRSRDGRDGIDAQRLHRPTLSRAL
jgi:hypothetical protein